jgi:hypothetical protein
MQPTENEIYLQYWLKSTNDRGGNCESFNKDFLNFKEIS